MKKTIQYLALVLSLVLILSVFTLPTLAVIVTQTGSLINTFLSGFEPTGRLVIEKTVRHPFGPNYAVPDNDHTHFGFTVDLGQEHAGDTFGSFTADHSGRFDVYIRANGSVEVPDIPVGTQATVTEHTPGPGFTPPESQTITMALGENRLPLINVYDPHEVPGTDLTIRGRKTLEGRDWQAGDCFVFALEVLEGDQWTALGQQTVEYTLLEQPDPANPENTILLPPANFDRFDFTDIIRSYPLKHAGIYSFRVIEVEGSIPGITYDKMESRLDITVGDADMDGWLEIQDIDSPSANTDISDLDIFIEFENEYAPLGSDEVTIDITKELIDKSGQDKEPSGFEFALYDEEGQLVQTSRPTDALGHTEIRLIYETKHAGQTFRYTLREINEGKRGMTYDETIFDICVYVTEETGGIVTAVIREDIPEEKPIVPEETVPGETLPEEMVSEESAPEESIPEESTPEESIPEESTPEESIPEESVPEESISEESVPEEFLSTEELPLEETVEQLPHSVSFSFTNTYEPEETSLTIMGHKTLTGRILQEEEFSFLLYRTSEGFALPEDASPIGRARNSAEGGFTFAELSFRSAGWHYFLVTEDASDAVPGIRYDDTRYRVRVYVEDIGGRLSVQNAIVENPSGEDSDILFRNAYSPADAIFHLTGRKLLDGRPLEDGEFTFQLYEASYLTAYGFTRGDLIARASNDLLEDGTGSFNFRIQYSEPGVFHYILLEVPGEEEGMTYDETQYGIEVVVTDNQVGSLQAEITRLVQIGTEDTDAEEILFRNTYTEPEDTTPTETTRPDETTEPEDTTGPDRPGKPGKLPQTGQLWWPVPVLLFLGCALVLLGLFRRRGNCHEEKR